MATCKYCGDTMNPERAEMYDYCKKPPCYNQGFTGPQYVVLGMHKSAPVCVSLNTDEVTAKRSYMVVK